VGSIRGGRPRNDTDPYDDRTEAPLLILSQHCVGEEVRQPVNLPSQEQVNNPGTNSFPDTIEWGVIDSVERHDREIGVFAVVLGEGCSEEI